MTVKWEKDPYPKCDNEGSDQIMYFCIQSDQGFHCLLCYLQNLWKL